MERLDRLVLAHRRLLAAVCAGLAVLLALAALDDGISTRRVVVAAADLDAGTVLSHDDVRFAELASSDLPSGAVTLTDDVVGRPLAGPVRAGELLTDRRVVDPRDLAGYDVSDPGLATVRVADPAVLSVLRVGDRVDVVAIDPHGDSRPEVIARSVVVAALPTSTDTDVVGLVAPAEVAVALAAAGLDSGLTLVAS